MTSQDTAAKLAREFAALNTATERAHAAIADMRAERKLLTALLAEVREVTAHRAEAMIEAALVPRLERMGKRIGEAMDEGMRRVSGQVDYWLEISMGTDAYSRLRGRPSIPDLITRAQGDCDQTNPLRGSSGPRRVDS